MGNKVQRRFVELSVGEVSLVDSPANEEEFAVIKSLNSMEENEMPDEKKAEETAVEKKAEEEKIEKAETEKVETEKVEAEKVEVEVEAPKEDAVQKAMEKVVSTVEAIAKSVGIEGKEESMEKTEEEKAEKVEEEKTEKAEAEAKADDDSFLEKLSEVIEKAKRFTPNRASALKAAVEQLSKLVQDLESPTKEAKAAPMAGTFGESGIKEITKSIEGMAESFKTSFAEVTEVTKKLGDRIEQIEKERKPSKSVSDEGGTDTKVKKENSLWSGVL